MDDWHPKLLLSCTYITLKIRKPGKKGENTVFTDLHIQLAVSLNRTVYNSREMGNNLNRGLTLLLNNLENIMIWKIQF